MFTCRLAKFASLKLININSVTESSKLFRGSPLNKIIPGFVTVLHENFIGSCSGTKKNKTENNFSVASYNAFESNFSHLLKYPYLYRLLERFLTLKDNHVAACKMSSEAVAQLENNSQTADNLIQEIYSKLDVLQKCNPEMGAEVQKLLAQNEALQREVDSWKEMLILQQIRNGGNPVVRDAKLIERSSVAAAVKQEPTNTPAPAVTEIKTEAVSPAAPQQGGKKVKKGGGGGGTPADGGSKGGKPKTGGEAANAESSEEVDIGRLDLRIGLIKECSRHPDADSLYVEKIDVGEPNLRTVISGLVKHVPLDAMQNRLVVVLCNLKPSKMRGIMSEAMVMCASSPAKVEIMIPPSGSAPGDVIEVDGYTRRPDSVLNPKKKIFETVAPDLKTNDNKQATYKGVVWTVPGKGSVVSESLCNVNIK